MIYLHSPGLPPSSNNAYFNLPGGGRSLTKEGRKYKNETIAFLSREFPSELKIFKINTPYFIYARFHFLELEYKGWSAKKLKSRKSTEKRYKNTDVSNRLKLFEDCLKDVGGVDDSQFSMIFIEKRITTVQPYTDVFVWNLEEEVPPVGDLIRL